MIPLTYTRSDWGDALLASSLLYKQAEVRFGEVAKMTKKMTKAKETGLGIPCRACVHAENGRVGIPKICTMNYECYDCPYDPMLDEMDLVRSLNAPRYQVASGIRIADGYPLIGLLHEKVRSPLLSVTKGSFYHIVHTYSNSRYFPPKILRRSQSDKIQTT